MPSLVAEHVAWLNLPLLYKFRFLHRFIKKEDWRQHTEDARSSAGVSSQLTWLRVACDYLLLRASPVVRLAALPWIFLCLPFIPSVAGHRPDVDQAKVSIRTALERKEPLLRVSIPARLPNVKVEHHQAARASWWKRMLYRRVAVTAGAPQPDATVERINEQIDTPTPFVHVWAALPAWYRRLWLRDADRDLPRPGDVLRAIDGERTELGIAHRETGVFDHSSTYRKLQQAGKVRRWGAITLDDVGKTVSITEDGILRLWVRTKHGTWESSQLAVQWGRAKRPKSLAPPNHADDTQYEIQAVDETLHGLITLSNPSQVLENPAEVLGEDVTSIISAGSSLSEIEAYKEKLGNIDTYETVMRHWVVHMNGIEGSRGDEAAADDVLASAKTDAGDPLASWLEDVPDELTPSTTEAPRLSIEMLEQALREYQECSLHAAELMTHPSDRRSFAQVCCANLARERARRQLATFVNQLPMRKRRQVRRELNLGAPTADEATLWFSRPRANSFLGARDGE